MAHHRAQAIIFDMDGVIVDSMPYHFLAWYEALRPLGVRVSCFDVFAKEGERWDKSLKDFLRRAGIRPTRNVLAQLFSRRQKIFKKYFKRFIFKGVRPLLSCLKGRGYALGLVTGTPQYEISRILPQDIRRYFDFVVAGDEVKKGKPHPEPYLKASKGLGVKPNQCVVIENAPYGIASAKSAGMHCIALTTSLPAAYLRQADAIADSLTEIPEQVSRICMKSRRRV